jgi:hypothetical protein
MPFPKKRKPLQFTEEELRTLESIRESRSAPQQCETLQHDQASRGLAPSADAMAETRRFQLSVSSRSRLRPAGVSR